jgi:hypothetical protein
VAAGHAFREDEATTTAAGREVSWNDQLDKGGVVVSDEVFVTLDVEAILAEDLATVSA